METLFTIRRQRGIKREGERAKLRSSDPAVADPGSIPGGVRDRALQPGRPAGPQPEHPEKTTAASARGRQ